MASLKENLDACKAAFDDIDSKPIPKKKKFYDNLMDDLRPRRKTLAAELADYIPTDVADVDGEVKNQDGKTIATVVDGVVILL